MNTYNKMPWTGVCWSPVHGEVQYEVERVKQQSARADLHEERPAGRGQLRHRGAPQGLEERGDGQDGGQVPVQHGPKTVEPPAERRRRPRARGDPPGADPPTHAAQRVQHQERCAQEEVRE